MRHTTQETGSSNGQLGIAVIGLGRWGPNHVRNFDALENCQIVAGVDPDEDCRERIVTNYPHVACVADYRAVLKRPDVDAVVVATPTNTHYSIVKAALEARKHVLAEKPLTDSSDLAWELVELAHQLGKNLMVGHVFLFNPGIECLHQFALEQQVGQPFYIKAVRTNLGPFRSDVNAAWDLASHDIYIFNQILNMRPVSVSAVGASFLRRPVEDIVFLTLEYPGGVLGHIHVSWLDPRKVRFITLVGEKKMITWDEFGQPGPVMVYDRSVIRDPIYDTFGEFQLLAREGNVMIPRVPSREPLAAQARAFIQRCRGDDVDTTKGSCKQGAEVVDILNAVSRSMANGGRAEEIAYGG